MLSDIAKNIEIAQTHPYFHAILGELIDANGIIVYDIVGNKKLVKIDHKVLSSILNDSPVFQEFVDYVAKKTGGFYTVG